MARVVKKVAAPGRKVTIKRQKVDTSELGVGHDRIQNGQVNPNRVGLGHGHTALPYDLPVDVEIFRVMGDMFDDFKGKPINGLLGHVIELNCWTKGGKPRGKGGVKIAIKLYNHPDGMTVEVDGKEVFKWVVNREELPVKFSEVLEEVRDVGYRFATSNNLKPGDEVVEVDGVIDIIRADEDEDFILDDDEEDIEWL